MTETQTVPVLKSGETIREAIQMAKLAAGRAAYYNAPAVKALSLVIVDQPFIRPGVPMTMAVDKYYRLYVGPKFVQDCVDMAEAVSDAAPCATCGDKAHHRLAYVAGVIVHEAWHLVRRHNRRFEATGYQDFMRWNIAADLELNDDIVEIFKTVQEPKLCLPPGVMLPVNFRKYPAMAKAWEKNPAKATWDKLDMKDTDATQAAWEALGGDDRLQLSGYHMVSKHGVDIWPLFTDNKLAEEYYILIPEPDPCPVHGHKCSGGDKSEDGQESEGSAEGDEESEDGQESGGSSEGCTCPWSFDHGSGAGGAKRSYERGAPTDGNDGVSEAEGELIANEVARNVKQGNKQQGNVPAGMEVWADQQLEEAKYDWKSELQKACRYGAGRKRGHQRRSYRRLGLLTGTTQGKILYPTKYDPIPNVTVVFDTSGSMGMDALRSGMQEVDGVMKGLGAKIRFTSVDASASELSEVSDISAVRLTGGGGTDMRVGIAKALEPKGPNNVPSVVIVMTDGFTPWPEEPLNGGSTQLIVCLVGDDAAELASVPSWALGIRITDDDVAVNSAA